MLCDICHKNIATVHLTEIINDKVVEMHICQNCTKIKTQELKDNLTIPELLTGLMDTAETPKKEISLKCPFCGLTYADFKKKARLGCGRCYSVFKVQILPLLKKIHGSLTYAGKSAVRAQKDSLPGSVKELKTRLERAVKLEEYEEAARLRDELKKLEQKETK
ncbi:MAG: UvrB/UvrC motif-containing protein [Candidatus Omnitrophica bacterium]|nr:UvrB/UvrC motif-containing protein [Candidatus Omnitrophota bacterium]